MAIFVVIFFQNGSGPLSSIFKTETEILTANTIRRAVRHLGFPKFDILTAATVHILIPQYSPPCQISRRLVKPLWRYDVRHLAFKNLNC